MFWQDCMKVNGEFVTGTYMLIWCWISAIKKYLFNKIPEENWTVSVTKNCIHNTIQHTFLGAWHTDFLYHHFLSVSDPQQNLSFHDQTAAVSDHAQPSMVNLHWNCDSSKCNINRNGHLLTPCLEFTVTDQHICPFDQPLGYLRLSVLDNITCLTSLSFSSLQLQLPNLYPYLRKESNKERKKEGRANFRKCKIIDSLWLSLTNR